LPDFVFKTSQLQANLLQKSGPPKPFSLLSTSTSASLLFNRFRNQKKETFYFGQVPKLMEIIRLPLPNQWK